MATGDFTYLIQKISGLLLLQAISMGLGFALNYFLIRVAGVGDYGSYVFIFNLLALLVNFCLFGGDTLVTRFVPLYTATGDRPRSSGVFYFALIVAASGATIVGLMSQFIANALGFSGQIRDMKWLPVACVSLLLLSVAGIVQAALQGTKKILWSQVGEKVIRPGVMLVAAMFLFFLGRHVSLSTLVVFNIVAIALSLIIPTLILFTTKPMRVTGVPAKFDSSAWVRNAAGFFLLGAAYMLNARIDIFLLGTIRGNEEVAVYNIVLKVS